jgi:hypothetical protein
VSDAAESSAEPVPLTLELARARSGLRRDVEALMAAFEQAELLVPLARDLPNAPEGERIELDGELTIVPHLLPDAEGQLFAALFTHSEPLEPIVPALDWTTGDEPLKVCAFPARIALEMALEVIDEVRVLGLVIDAGADSELCLTRAELASILAGRALPLMAYVGDIPEEERARTLLAEDGDPPPAALLAALQGWAENTPAALWHRLARTFNPDRDLEPHLTLTLGVAPGADRAKLFEGVTLTLEGKLPPPGYLDVLFEETRE